MLHLNHSPTAIERLRFVGQACLRRLQSLLGIDRELRLPATAPQQTRDEVFRRVQHEKWLGTKPTAQTATPRHGDLYKRPLVDLNDRCPGSGGA